jgi:hypothetical protein
LLGDSSAATNGDMLAAAGVTAGATFMLNAVLLLGSTGCVVGVAGVGCAAVCAAGAGLAGVRSMALGGGASTASKFGSNLLIMSRIPRIAMRGIYYTAITGQLGRLVEEQWLSCSRQ